VVQHRWRVDGTHYPRTSDAWLANLDRERAAILPILRETYGAGEERLWLQRWRLFFLGCSELFGYRHGQEWWVTHVAMGHRGAQR
jgi:cyclopropane-fatty-acyl-phospholipid synthase